METNGNGKPNQVKHLVKPHILLIGLVLVAFNSYWCLIGTLETVSPVGSQSKAHVS